jgi:hypothetical protein
MLVCEIYCETLAIANVSPNHEKSFSEPFTQNIFNNPSDHPQIFCVVAPLPRHGEV